ncbi:MAG: ATP synthase F1 subunit gamma [Planctomycetes bacterium]|nr:ATP synthase F1 subunit gamma [Planctomycetota bacterium]
MAEQPKEIRNRIRSVTSTKKITRTMELVATSKMKRAQERVKSAQPYSAKLEELMGELAAAGSNVDEPLLQERDEVKSVRVLLVTANRGLCGGYNANVVKECKRFIDKLKAEGKEVHLDICGKKGIGTLGYQGYAIDRKYTDLTDRPTYDDALRMIEPLKEDFLKGRADEVYVVYTQWVTAATQKPLVKQVLPIQRPEASAGASAEYIFDPEPAVLLAQLLPMYLTQTMYTCIVEAIAGEQVARRTAMKSATDNATEMVTSLTRTLNRARQAQITQEIAELVGGAEALKK